MAPMVAPEVTQTSALKSTPSAAAPVKVGQPVRLQVAAAVAALWAPEIMVVLAAFRVARRRRKAISVGWAAAAEVATLAVVAPFRRNGAVAPVEDALPPLQLMAVALSGVALVAVQVVASTTRMLAKAVGMEAIAQSAVRAAVAPGDPARQVPQALRGPRATTSVLVWVVEAARPILPGRVVLARSVGSRAAAAVGVAAAHLLAALVEPVAAGRFAYTLKVED